MVGVAGKYKGCETCRARRVKCDNTRPLCRKCLDSGRECLGYERETVFIVGTPDDQGRCASHPPRTVTGSKKPKIESAVETQPVNFEVATVEPLQSAWDDPLALSSVGGLHRFRFIAVHTKLDSVRQSSGPQSPDDAEVTLSLPDYQPLSTHPLSLDEEFHMRCVCFVHLSPTIEGSSSQSVEDGFYLSLYEQNASSLYNNEPPWKDPGAVGTVRQLGPAAFQEFPTHHYFARLYRPGAIFAAILSHQPTFLSSPEWTTVPWERHPKEHVDLLLDIVSLFPTIFSRADRVFPGPPSVPRRLKAKDVLANCAVIERQLTEWYEQVDRSVANNAENPLLYWIAESSAAAPVAAQPPFAETYEFASPQLCLAHIYYWAALMRFYACIDTLLAIVGDDASSFSTPASTPRSQGSSSSSTAPQHIDMPPGMDPFKYQRREIRKLAANVCRSLDFALQHVGQPDALAAPLQVIEGFFQELRGNGDGDGELEVAWCAAFRARAEAKGREVCKLVEDKGKKWIEVGRFGYHA